MTSYALLRAPRHDRVRVRGLEMRLTRWGPEPSHAEPPVVLLHGFQDTGETFQFLVDAFEGERPLAAPDWRGFGRSEWPQNGYWFPDYLADLEGLLEILSPNAPARLVGHSMGGNIASLYAGLRPHRVRSLVNLEGFGMPRISADQAPKRLRQWLDQVKSVPPLKDYDSFEQLASIIRHRYPRFTDAQSDFIAAVWGKLEADGRVHLLGDPRHRRVNPVLYRHEEAEACWREITAPVLVVVGEESDHLSRLGEDGSALLASLRRVQIARIPGAGHMLHIERPALIAPLIENFLAAY